LNSFHIFLFDKSDLKTFKTGIDVILPPKQEEGGIGYLLASGHTLKPVVNNVWASGLVVMTSRLQRGDRLFNSGLAHSFFIFIYFQVNNINNFIKMGRD
jgi:hypothetical protein